jgi:NADH dehydrogenase FAD-containing subunit
VDRTNHHLFQPLLYQVAISVLTPGQIASPIRGILRKQRNTTVIMGEVTGVDKDRRCVFVNLQIEKACRCHTIISFWRRVQATATLGTMNLKNLHWD